MQPPNQHSRIDLTELKAQIVKRVGPEGAKQYFFYLNRFLSVKMSKLEFDRQCFRILGRENIPLHNQLIRSILKNACAAKSPPPQKNDILKHGKQVCGKEMSANAYLQNGSHAGVTQASGSQGFSNGGDILPISPRKARTSFRDRRAGDSRSVLGPNGMTSVTPQLPTVTRSGDVNVILENGDLHPHHGHAQRAESALGVSGPDPTKISGLRRSSDDSAPTCRNDKTESVSRSNDKESSARVPLQAPLGVPFCPVSIGGARRSLPSESSSTCIQTSDYGILLDSHMLRDRMEQIALAHNLEGVSMDCANVLNHGLDSYLKRLIGSCVDLIGARSSKNNTDTHMKVVNGVRPGYQYQSQNSGKILDAQQRIQYPISLQDFRIAMELNPPQLGEDWPVLLEKICTRAYEE